MRVRVLYFGVLREAFGREQEGVELPTGATAADLIEQCRGRAIANETLWDAIAVAVNREYVSRGRVLAEGDEVALLPPVSGGAACDAISGTVASKQRCL